MRHLAVCLVREYHLTAGDRVSNEMEELVGPITEVVQIFFPCHTIVLMPLGAV